MPQWKSYLGCGIPQDKAAREICMKKNCDWQPGSLDPRAAAVNEIKRIVDLSEQDPFKNPPTVEEQKKAILEIEKKIRNMLAEQKKLAVQEDKERKKRAKELGEQLMADAAEKQAMQMARNAGY